MKVLPGPAARASHLQRRWSGEAPALQTLCAFCPVQHFQQALPRHRPSLPCHPQPLSCCPSESFGLGRHDKPGDPGGLGRAGAEGCEGKVVAAFAAACSLIPSIPATPGVAAGGWLCKVGLWAAPVVAGA